MRVIDLCPGEGAGLGVSAPLLLGIHGFFFVVLFCDPDWLAAKDEGGESVDWAVPILSFQICVSTVSSSVSVFFFFFLLRYVQKKNNIHGFSKPEQAFPLKEEAAIQKRAGSSASWLSSSGVLCLEQLFF